MKQQPQKKSTTEDVEKPLEQKAPKQKRHIEISPEAQEERRLLSAFLLDKKEELIQERNRRKKKIEEEEIQLQGGKTISRLGIKQFVQSLKRDYTSIFPNENPFFKNMFRLHPRLAGYNPNKYEKPYLAGKLLNKLTYNRFSTDFSQEVLAALIVFAMPDGIRLFKCHEFLTPAGVEQMIKFRDEANKMMDKYEDGQWYEFLKEFSAKYKQVFQPKML